jgi:hypothetical protein
VAKHASTLAKKVAVLTDPAVAIGLRTAQHLHTHGTVVTTEAHHAKTHVKTRPVRRVVVGKTAAVTTATALALPPVALQATSLHAVINLSFHGRGQKVCASITDALRVACDNLGE